MISVSIVGGSGYTGGEALRLLLGHPQVRINQVTSESNAGKFVHSVHPNLRKRTDLEICQPAQISKRQISSFCAFHMAWLWITFRAILVWQHESSTCQQIFVCEIQPTIQLWYEHEHPKSGVLKEGCLWSPRIASPET